MMSTLRWHYIARSTDEEIEEIYHLFLDEIACAEKFIYIENQFLVSKKSRKP